MTLVTAKQIEAMHGIKRARLSWLTKKKLVRVEHYAKNAHHVGMYDLDEVLEANAKINTVISDGVIRSIKKAPRKRVVAPVMKHTDGPLKTVLEYRADGMRVVDIAKRLGMRWQDVVAEIEGAK